MTSPESRHTLTEAAERLIGLLAALPEQKPESPVRVAVGIDEVNLLSWLQAQHATTKVYWRSRDENLEIAAIGATHTVSGNSGVDLDHDLSDLPHHLNSTQSSVRYIGGIRFDITTLVEQRDDCWQGFSGYRFILPQIELIRRDNTTELAVNVHPDRIQDISAIMQLLKNIAPPSSNDESLSFAISTRTDTPDKSSWSRAVEQALELFGTTELSKIVLARRSDFSSTHSFDPWQLLAGLQQTSTGCTLFGFSFDGKTTFLGATPERLYARNGSQVSTEALAGTRPRGEDASKDKLLEAELLGSEKEQREHSYVARGVFASLVPLSLSVMASKSPTIVKLARVQHLKTPIEASLQHDTTDSDLLTALHPTAAVNGQPRDLALKLLQTIEPFDRGWYAAPVGWLSKESAEFAVAIRSGLVNGSHLALFAGAGIVEGSSPDNEWSELDNKLSAFLQAIDTSTKPSVTE